MSVMLMLGYVSTTCRDSLMVSHCLILSHINKSPLILMGVEVLFNCLVRYVAKLLIARVI
jgi:hypothetical protein